MSNDVDLLGIYGVLRRIKKIFRTSKNCQSGLQGMELNEGRKTSEGRDMGTDAEAGRNSSGRWNGDAA